MIFQKSGCQLYYETFGKGKPVLILHGLAGNLDTMVAVFEPIFQKKSGFKRYYVDLPGMGNSRAPLNLASSDELLKILLAFFHEVIIDPFLLVGYSYGGYLAQAIAAQSKKVKAVFLLAPVVIAEQDKRHLPTESWFSQTEIFKDALGCYNALKKPNDEQFLTNLEEKYALTDSSAIFKKFENPTLIMLGHQDEIVGFSDQQKLLSLYPRSTVVLLDEAGHNLQFEQKEFFRLLTEDWLERSLKILES